MHAASSTASHRSAPSAPAQIEPLETRKLLSAAVPTVSFHGGMLTVIGTKKADEIVFSLVADDPTKLSVSANGTTSVFNVSEVIGIQVDAGGGNDTVILDESNGAIAIGATVLGGKGNDLIIGGSGNDRLYGNAGRDDLSGGAGSDWVIGGDGTDMLNGGTDFNIIGLAGRDGYVFAGGNDIIVPDMPDVTTLA